MTPAGLLRVHEFDKVELFAYSTPDQAPELLESMVARAEALLRQLGLQYRVLDLCTGDIGNSAARTFDLEVYSPGVDMWLEVSSVSWCTDYQARRANIRYRPEWRRRPGVRAHPQRFGPGLGPDLGRHRGDRPSGRRLGGAARRARPLPAGRNASFRRPAERSTGRRAQSRVASKR